MTVACARAVAGAALERMATRAARLGDFALKLACMVSRVLRSTHSSYRSSRLPVHTGTRPGARRRLCSAPRAGGCWSGPARSPAYWRTSPRPWERAAAHAGTVGRKPRTEADSSNARCVESGSGWPQAPLSRCPGLVSSRDPRPAANLNKASGRPPLVLEAMTRIRGMIR
jgi:hypothetical protein